MICFRVAGVIKGGVGCKQGL